MKPIEMERQSEWRDLRQKVYHQPNEVAIHYKVGIRKELAAQAIRNLARKYEFKVSIAFEWQSIIVYKHARDRDIPE